MDIKELIRRAKLRMLQMHYDANVGHIGGNLSALDTMVVLHARVMTEKDILVLSKGHAAGALYASLWIAGKLPEIELENFHRDGTKLAGHPIGGWHQSILFSSGSLGHGLSLASGVALARKLRGAGGNIYCLMSDGEWQEGSNWEALIFLAHHALNNLFVLIDENGLQGFGRNRDIASLDSLKEKLSGFRVDVREIDGHAADQIAAALRYPSERPRVVILRTVKGHGVSFMEDRMEWHYLPMTETQYRMAREEIERG
jgi:transketolase